MSAKHRIVARSGSPKKSAAAPRVPSKSPAALPKLPAWKLWLYRLMAVTLPAPLLILCLEGALRLGGYGYETQLVLKDVSGQFLHENDEFLWRFYSPNTKLQPHPFLVPVHKGPDTMRIVVLGESAALGTPEPAFGFWRMLDHQLRHDFPDRKFEVINLAMRGINSHIILPIAKEALQLKPDFFVVYMGNNEVVGLHAPGPESRFFYGNLRLYRFVDWTKGTRSAQLLLSFVSKEKPEQEQDMEFFRAHRVAADDPRRLAVYRNFETNLTDICNVISKSGARMLLCTVPVNLKNCPPLGSLHKKGISSGADEQYAEGHFIAAESLTNDPAAMRQEYEMARDWDAMQFRADNPVNAAIRRTATGLKIPLLDAEKIFAQNGSGVPGRELFYEHVHLRFAGDHLLAENLYPAILSELGLESGTNALASRERCAKWLAYTSWNEFRMESSILQLRGSPPFLDQYRHDTDLQADRRAFTNKFIISGMSDMKAAHEIYLAAIREATNDWHLHYNLANLYSAVQNHRRAAEEFEIASRLMPHYQPVRLMLANEHARAGHPAEALATLEEGLKINPKCHHIKRALNQARGRR